MEGGQQRVDEDLQWVRRCQQGDREAFEPLVKKYYERAIRIAYSVVRRREDAVDVAQAAFLKAYQNLSKFSERSRFSTWLYRIVWNQAIDWKRYRGRRAAESLEQKQEEQGFEPPRESAAQPVDDPREAAFGREMQSRLEEALEELSPEHRQAFVLREVEGLSYSEIAEVSGAPLGTVMSRLHYARQVLREKMEEYL